MVRLARYVLPGQPQHVIQRGNSRETIFFTDEDYHYFYRKLVECSSKHECRVHAYVLMPNHLHLVLTPLTRHGISKLMQSLGRYYVQYINSYYQRTGTLWEGRYKATVMDSQAYLLDVMRYIEFNPVRADLVDEAQAYRWSSYHCNALGKTDELVKAHRIYRMLGADRAERQRAYRRLCQAPLDESVITAIRDSTNKAWALGDQAFRNRIQNLLGRRSTPRPRGGDRRSAAYRRAVKNHRV